MLIGYGLTSNAMQNKENRLRQAGKWLSNEQRKTGVTQKAAADKAGIHATQISRIFNAASGTTPETLDQYISAINELSTGYKIDIDEAFERYGVDVRSWMAARFAALGADASSQSEL